MTYKYFEENRKFLDEDIVVTWGEFKGRRVSDMSFKEMRRFMKTPYRYSRNYYFNGWFKKLYRQINPYIDDFWNEFEKG